MNRKVLSTVLAIVIALSLIMPSAVVGAMQTDTHEEMSFRKEPLLEIMPEEGNDLTNIDDGDGAVSAELSAALFEVAGDSEEEVTSPDIDIIASDDPAQFIDGNGLFDGVPAYETSDEVTITAEDGALDGGPGLTEQELLDSFYDTPEEEDGIYPVQPDSDLDGAVIADSVGDDFDSAPVDNTPPAFSCNGETIEPTDSASIEAAGRDPDATGSDLDGGRTPNGYTIQLSSSKCAVGSYITLHPSYTNTTLAHLVVYNRTKGIQKVYRIPQPNLTYRLDFQSAGNYDIYMCLYNAYGSYDGSKHNGIGHIRVGAAPQAYYMTINKTKTVSGQPVTLKINRKNATKATLYIKNASTGQQMWSGAVSSQASFTFSGTGRVAFYLVTENEFGTYDGSKHSGMTLYCTITLAPPTAYQWSISSTRIPQKGTATVSVKGVGGATQATLVMEHNGKIIAQRSINTNKLPQSVTIQAGNATGTFKLYLITKNSVGTYNGRSHGQTLQFSITGQPSDYWMKISKTSCNVGETINFTIDPKDSSYYYFVIEWDGRVVVKQNCNLNKGVQVKLRGAGLYRFYLITYNVFGSFNGGAHDGYSLTCRVTEPTRVFSPQKDGYRFVNYHTHLGYTKGVDKISLESYQSVFGNVKGWLNYSMDGTWGGSCFGFSSSSAWAFENPSANFSSRYGASTQYGIPTPYNKNSSTTRMLERYQISQGLDKVQNERSAHHNDVKGLVDAVESFERGGKAVIFCMNETFGGHAIVPIEHRQSGTKHFLYVYDCNRPGETGKVTIYTNSAGSYMGMYYENGYTWQGTFDFCYADTVYNAMPSKARSAQDGADEADTIMAILSGDAKEYTCANSSGAVDLAQYEVQQCDSSLDGHLYYLPIDQYTLTCIASDSETFSCAVSNGSTGANATATGGQVTFYIGCNDQGELRCSARSNQAGKMDIALANDAGQLSHLSADGSYLGVSTDGSSLQMTSDTQTVERNGEPFSLTLGSTGGGELDGTADVALGTDAAFDGASAEKLKIAGRPTNLIYNDEGLVGTLTLATENPGSMGECSLYVACYDENGRMLGVENTSAVIGSGQGAAVVELNGHIHFESIRTGSLTFKVFLMDDGSAPLCEAAVFSDVVLQ